jgi:capsular exopolysaccharide synthesis family protein
LHFLDYWRVIKVRSGIIALTFLLVVITAGITCYFLPRQYYSKVTMEVKPDDARLKIFSNEGMRGTTDLRFAPTQFQIIQQKEILYPVIDSLKLVDKWSAKGPALPREAVYYKLRKAMDMHEVRNTDLLEIGVYSTDSKEAADIANSIAVVYQDKRRTDQETLLNRGLSQLEEEVNKQRKKVEEASADAARIRVQEKIVDLNPEIIENADTADTQRVLADEKEANDARVRVAELKTQLEQIEKLKPEEVMVALHLLNIDDPTIIKILPLYQESVAQEATMLNSGLGIKHPKVLSLRATKDVYQKQLSDQIEALRHSLATRLTISQTTLASLEEKLTNTKDAYTTKKNQSSEYIEAKSKYIQAKRILEQAELKYNSEKMQGQITFTPAKIWEKAEPAIYPTKPNVPIYMALAVLVGLIVGVGLAFFIEYLDTSVKTLEDVEKFLGVPVLAVIPKNVGLLFKHGGEESPDAEAFRILRTNIEFNRKNPDANTITVISGGPGEGKSTTLCNLAYTCAKGGYNVLLVDCDLRRPSQHRNFEMDNTTGLTNYLTGNAPYEDFIVPTVVKNLSFIPSGILPADSIGILNSQRMSDLIFKAKRQYDLVFLDSPPILGVSDGSVIASEVDLTVMVIEHRRFPRSMLQRVKSAILNVGGNLLGVVLNKVDTKHDQGYQYYTNYYDYYSPQQAEKSRRKDAKAAAGQGPKVPAPHDEQY